MDIKRDQKMGVSLEEKSVDMVKNDLYERLYTSYQNYVPKNNLHEILKEISYRSYKKFDKKRVLDHGTCEILLNICFDRQGLFSEEEIHYATSIIRKIIDDDINEDIFEILCEKELFPMIYYFMNQNIRVDDCIHMMASASRFEYARVLLFNTLTNIDIFLQFCNNKTSDNLVKDILTILIIAVDHNNSDEMFEYYAEYVRRFVLNIYANSKKEDDLYCVLPSIRALFMFLMKILTSQMRYRHIRNNCFRLESIIESSILKNKHENTVVTAIDLLLKILEVCYDCDIPNVNYLEILEMIRFDYSVTINKSISRLFHYGSKYKRGFFDYLDKGMSIFSEINSLCIVNFDYSILEDFASLIIIYIENSSDEVILDIIDKYRNLIKVIAKSLIIDTNKQLQCSIVNSFIKMNMLISRTPDPSHFYYIWDILYTSGSLDDIINNEEFPNINILLNDCEYLSSLVENGIPTIDE